MPEKATPPVPRVTVTIARKPASEVREILYTLPEALSGAKPDKAKLRQVFLGNFARQFFHSTHDAFLTKSKGGTDDVGITWKPLAPETIQSKLSKSRKSGRLPSTTTTPGQKKAWTQSYHKAYSQYKSLGHGHDSAVTKARETAWNQLRRGKAGLPKVPIGIDTHRLENSLRPGKVGSSGTYLPHNDDQFLRLSSRGKTRFGTKVPYAKYFHAKRRVYPDVDRIDPWLQAAVEAGRDALIRHLESLL